MAPDEKTSDTSPEEVTVNFKMEKDLNLRLKALAKKRFLSFAGLMRLLGTEELEREEGKK